MSGGYTVNPSYDSEGHYQGSEVVQHRQSGLDRNGSYSGWENDFVETEDGRTEYQPQLEEAPSEEGGWDFDDYLGSVIDERPELLDIVKDAENIPGIAPFIEEWNTLINGDDPDLDRLHQLIDMFTREYQAHNPEAKAQVELDEWYEANFESIEQDFDALQDTEFTIEQAEQMASIASDFTPGGVEQAILKAGIDLAFNKTTFEDAYTAISKKYGNATAAQAYYQLMDVINN